MNKKNFLVAFVQNRHLNATTIAVAHKYNALNRTARLNCNHAMIFACTNSEKDTIREEHMPPSMDKHQFNSMMQEAFTPEPDMPKPFLWINGKVDMDEKFRKSLDTILKPKSK